MYSCIDGGEFNQRQVSQIMNIFKQAQLGQGKASGSEINANKVAGTILKYSGICFKTFDHNTWIIDTGDSVHM